MTKQPYKSLTPTEIVFILDRSGSMATLEKDTIGGFNSMLNKQKEEHVNAIVSTVLFDDEAMVLHDRLPISQIPEMTHAEYQARGTTALLDAIGSAIKHIGTIHKYARKEDRPAKTLFIITTDGLENSSRIYSIDKVKAMIERQKSRYKWEFLFLGANIDAISTARSFGIDERTAVNYKADKIGTRKIYDELSETICCCCKEQKLNKDWKKNIEEDYLNRK